MGSRPEIEMTAEQRAAAMIEERCALQLRLQRLRGDATDVVLTSELIQALHQEIDRHPLPGGRSDPFAGLTFHVCASEESAQQMHAKLTAAAIKAALLV